MRLNVECDMSGWANGLALMRERLENADHVMEKIGDEGVDVVKLALDNSGLEEPFEPLKPSTLTRERLQYGTKPLLKTRELYNTITRIAGSTWVEIGSPLVKSWALFLGSTPKNIPARNALAFPVDQLRRWAGYVAEYIVRGYVS